METQEFKMHGQRVRREYAPRPGGAEGMAGDSTDEQRPGGKISGVVNRYRKHQSSSRHPIALGWIKAIHPAAIEYTNVTKELKGLAFTFGLLFGPLFFSSGVACGFYTLGGKTWSHPWDDPFWFIFCSALSVAQMIVGMYFLVFFIRHDLFRPSDLPIIFDRRNRMIYRILMDVQPGLLGVVKRWPIVACEYEWDLVDAEHQATVFTTGGTVQRDHRLMFIVRKGESDPTIIDSFQIASSIVLDSELVDSMWEHIRRFMEEHGPHLPTPREKLADLQAPASWWQSMGAVGPFGPNYFQRWRDSTMVTAVLHLFFPLTIPMLLVWGTGNWLSYKTAIPVAWPEEVLQRVRK